MIKDLSETGRKTAKTLYGANGWVAQHNTDIWRIAGPVDLRMQEFGLMEVPGLHSIYGNIIYLQVIKIFTRLLPCNERGCRFPIVFPR